MFNNQTMNIHYQILGRMRIYKSYKQEFHVSRQGQPTGQGRPVFQFKYGSTCREGERASFLGDPQYNST